MNTIQTIILVIEWVFLVYFGFSAIYVLIFSFASLLPAQKVKFPVGHKRKFAVLIPGYKEDNVIVDVASDALKQNYPAEGYDVVIIADSFKEDTLNRLRALPVKLVEVSFETSTKSKALNKAMEQLPEDYDFALVLDADNLMETGFLLKINAAFDDKIMAMQAHRTAKNMETSLATLDAISEEINNSIFRKGHRKLGLSSAIIGSGMVFPYAYFRSMMQGIKAIGGFDKEIELTMLKQKHRIGYLEDAYVYDEKVSQSGNFSNQRRRWLSAQLHYFRKYFFDALLQLLTRGNMDYFDKAWQMLMPPRALMIGLYPLLLILFLLVNQWTEASLLSEAWVVVAISAYLGIMLAVPRKFLNMNTLKAVAGLPKGIFLMLLSLLKIKGANRKFIHTTHGNP